MRVLIALGGNAMTGPDGSATPQAQREAIAVAKDHVATVVAAGHQVVLTHGNGPQVGNLLVKNELAANVVPPVPLDWCGAQTQGTIGFTILDTLEPALAARGLTHPVAALVTRTLVDPDDPGFATPTKPIGRFLPHDQARPLSEHGCGEVLVDHGLDAVHRAVGLADHGYAATTRRDDDVARREQGAQGVRLEHLQRFRGGDHAAPALVTAVLPGLAVRDQR